MSSVISDLAPALFRERCTSSVDGIGDQAQPLHRSKSHPTRLGHGSFSRPLALQSSEAVRAK
jgi:hypothetical protein